MEFCSEEQAAKLGFRVATGVADERLRMAILTWKVPGGGEPYYASFKIMPDDQIKVWVRLKFPDGRHAWTDLYVNGAMMTDTAIAEHDLSGFLHCCLDQHVEWLLAQPVA